MRTFKMFGDAEFSKCCVYTCTCVSLANFYLLVNLGSSLIQDGGKMEAIQPSYSFLWVQHTSAEIKNIKRSSSC